METITIDIINPKAKKLLKDLMELDLISIRKHNSKSNLKTLLSKTRKYSNNAISIDEITKEVEIVRQEMYEQGKNNS